jgi:DNA-binding transcriptional MerR regulator/methylmalonyl-CoA mutase cobalamin-binding subunit
MSTRASSKAPPVHRHPMRVVTRRTGLSADLLRAWEKRYEVVKPARSSGGRRLYSDADIERLRLLYRATLAGRGIGQVAALSAPALAALVRRDADAERADADGRAPSAGAGAPAPATTEYLAGASRAIERLDAHALEAVLRRAVVALPVATLLEELVTPLLERIGGRWREGTLRPVHGHLATVVLRRVLDRVIDTASAPDASPHLVVATPAGQAHEFGALLTAATAAAEGWRVTYLGAGLPAEDIAEAAVRTRARAVALSLVYPAGDAAVGHELRRLRALLPVGVTTLAGGAAASAYRTPLDETGTRLLGDLGELRAMLRALRPAGRARHARRGREAR